MYELDAQRTACVSGAGGDDGDLITGVGMIVGTGLVAKGAAATMTVLPVVGLGAIAATGGYKVGTWIEDEFGVASGLGGWFGGTGIGSKLFNW